MELAPVTAAPICDGEPHSGPAGSDRSACNPAPTPHVSAPIEVPSSPDDWLTHRLTLVLVTSPVRSNPSTEMLERVLRSFIIGGGLGDCEKVIISDGFTVTGPDQKDKPKSGRVPAEWVAPYAEYRNRIDALVEAGATGSDAAFAHCSHVRMPEHKGFGGCLHCGARRASTLYILVLQHDRPCVRKFSARGVIATMEASADSVKYVGLPTKASLARCLPATLEARCHLKADPKELEPAVREAAIANDVQLQILLFWYDSAHFCLASHYRNFVFRKGRIPRNGFPEDSLGQELHTAVCAAAARERQRSGQAADAGPSWREVHAEYGTFLLDDGAGPMVGHLRGRNYLDDAELQRLGWVGWDHNHTAVVSSGFRGRPACDRSVGAEDEDEHYKFAISFGATSASPPNSGEERDASPDFAWTEDATNS